MSNVFHQVLNWLRGVTPSEEETWRLIRLRSTMGASEWLDLAEPHYERLLGEIDQVNDG